MYGILERQFRRYFAEADAARATPARTCCSCWKSRLDNVVYRMGFGSTRAEARQLVSHNAFTRERQGRQHRLLSGQGGRHRRRARKGKKQVRIVEALSLAEQIGMPSWVAVDAKKMEGTFKPCRTAAKSPTTSTNR